MSCACYQFGGKVYFAVLEQLCEMPLLKSLFWVAFLVWGLLRLQVASGKV
jgi:hypothetical protein